MKVSIASRAARVMLAALAASSLGCSGGQDDLHVSFYYPSGGCMRFATCEIVPSTLGLPASAPATFKVISGSLPAGLVLDADTGVISGVPFAVEERLVQFELTVEGYAGKILATATIGVFPVELLYSFTSYPANGFPINVAIPDVIPIYMLQGAMSGVRKLGDGVSVSYALADGTSLPPGITLDPVTGVISGTPTTHGAYYPCVLAHIEYQGQSLDLSFNDLYFPI